MEKNKQGKKGQLVIIISGKLRQRRQIIQTSQQGIGDKNKEIWREAFYFYKVTHTIHISIPSLNSPPPFSGADFFSPKNRSRRAYQCILDNYIIFTQIHYFVNMDCLHVHVCLKMLIRSSHIYKNSSSHSIVLFLVNNSREVIQ